MSPEEARQAAAVIDAKVLSNRKPPYSIAGGLYDVLKESNGDFYLATNNDIFSLNGLKYSCNISLKLSIPLTP